MPLNPTGTDEHGIRKIMCARMGTVTYTGKDMPPALEVGSSVFDFVTRSQGCADGHSGWIYKLMRDDEGGPSVWWASSLQCHRLSSPPPIYAGDCQAWRRGHTAEVR